MGDRDSSHTGIDLDVICIEELLDRDDGAPEKFQGSIRSDPKDYRVYLNGIIKRMQGREAFLTFSQQINNVNQILNMNYSSAGDIARVILNDLSLTAQVLKLVNSSFYRHFSNKGISTISEAMIILGTDEIRELAAGLKVFEMMKSRAGSRLLKDKMLRSLHRSGVAREIERETGVRSSDAFPISAMLYELGEYMVALLDPDTYIKVEVALEEGRLSKETAAKMVLGLSYFELGQMIALKFNFPRKIVQAMQPVTLTAGQTLKIAPKEEVRYLCAFVYELCNIPAPGNDAASLDAAGKLVDKYRGVLDFDAGQALALTCTAMDRVTRHAKILGVDPIFATPVTKASGIKNKEKLDIGINSAEEALDEGLSIHEIFTRLIDTMAQCFYFNQIIISIRKKETNTMEPRFIRGEKRPDGFSRAMGFKIEPASGIFNNAIERKIDIIVKDAKKEFSRRQIPSWYMEKIACTFPVMGFGIFPVFVDGKIVAMIYVDWDNKAPAPDRDTLAYIQRFRKLMIKAFTLHSK
ncbi:MAG: HDOD domain-containing protein [Desulfobacter sp.]|jgi:HD-like signal output (HDOD) protein|uniref:HDOD domain-containing protein n=1 Tax=uncultured Desulfobacter sp. TaxID=240139 RepID=UPI0029C804FB|nr:HDOD domain-containing protein [uncultured Desulfobacter sp.]MCW8800404.1 HDOD domain-containing protein [Desulfobacter sp.]